MHISVQLSENKEVATIIMRGRSEAIVAGCLGVECAENGEIDTIYLDRLITPPRSKEITGWSFSGAISTILHRI